jgi:hypothetical protein
VRDEFLEDCEIVGPAALIPVGERNRLLDCEFPIAPDSWVGVLSGRPLPILLVGCTLVRCRFALDVDMSKLARLVDTSG